MGRVQRVKKWKEALVAAANLSGWHLEMIRRTRHTRPIRALGHSCLLFISSKFLTLGHSSCGSGQTRINQSPKSPGWVRLASAWKIEKDKLMEK